MEQSVFGGSLGADFLTVSAEGKVIVIIGIVAIDARAATSLIRI